MSDPNERRLLTPEEYRAAQESPEFIELKRRFRRFAFPMTVAFFSWYLLYVLLSTYAPDSVKVTSASPINLTTNAGVRALGVSILGKNLSAATRAAIMAAPDAKYALAVLFVSPEFQRR